MIVGNKHWTIAELLDHDRRSITEILFDKAETLTHLERDPNAWRVQAARRPTSLPATRDNRADVIDNPPASLLAVLAELSLREEGDPAKVSYSNWRSHCSR